MTTGHDNIFLARFRMMDLSIANMLGTRNLSLLEFFTKSSRVYVFCLSDSAVACSLELIGLLKKKNSLV